MSGLTALVSTALLTAALLAAREATAAPYAWCCYSSAVWSIWLLLKGWNALHFWEKLHFFWGASSIVALCKFTQITLRTDDPFEGWGDIYFFCGRDYRYCSCDFTWNLAGWVKALVLWNFVVTASLGLQKLVIHSGLQGLLPGEEVVTKESLVSFCWRLIPYWLNSWEQQWGAECSSVMFELPHFAMELLVVLPCVQIMSSRLKILLMPPGRGLVPPFDQAPSADASGMAPAIMTGLWEHRKSDHSLKGRVRANLRVLTLIVGISALAACNALYVPLRLEQVIHTHPRSAALLEAAAADGWLEEQSHVTASEETYKSAELDRIVAQFDAKGCQDQNKLATNLVKHASEISKMQSTTYRDLTLCVEAALTIMRLSCEQYFTLISVLAAYLLFRQHPPLWAKRIIWLNHRVSTMFKKTILYSFPAICWVYGAGFMFSSFASLVFWGQPIARLWERLRALLTTVQPVGLQEATKSQIDQMNSNCAVCWSPMVPAGEVPVPSTASSSSSCEEEEEDVPLAATPSTQVPQPQELQGFMEVPYFPFHLAHGQDPLAPDPQDQEEEEDEAAADTCQALPCGHAFHTGCIARWLQQCHVQSRQVTCPMCNLVIKLEVSFSLARVWSRSPAPPVPVDQPTQPARPEVSAVQQAWQQGQRQQGQSSRDPQHVHQQSGIGMASSHSQSSHSQQRLAAEASLSRFSQDLDAGQASFGQGSQDLTLNNSGISSSRNHQQHAISPMHALHDGAARHSLNHHHQQQQQQQQQQALQSLSQQQQASRSLSQQQHILPKQWPLGLSTYQALGQPHTSAQLPDSLPPAPPMLARQSSAPSLNALEQYQAAWDIGHQAMHASPNGMSTYASSSSWQAPVQHTQDWRSHWQTPAVDRVARLPQADVQQVLPVANGAPNESSGQGLLSRLLRGRRRERVHQNRQTQLRQ